MESALGTTLTKLHTTLAQGFRPYPLAIQNVKPDPSFLEYQTLAYYLTCRMTELNYVFVPKLFSEQVMALSSPENTLTRVSQIADSVVGSPVGGVSSPLFSEENLEKLILDGDMDSIKALELFDFVARAVIKELLQETASTVLYLAKHRFPWLLASNFYLDPDWAKLEEMGVGKSLYHENDVTGFNVLNGSFGFDDSPYRGEATSDQGESPPEATPQPTTLEVSVFRTLDSKYRQQFGPMHGAVIWPIDCPEIYSADGLLPSVKDFLYSLIAQGTGFGVVKKLVDSKTQDSKTDTDFQIPPNLKLFQDVLDDAGLQPASYTSSRKDTLNKLTHVASDWRQGYYRYVTGRSKVMTAQLLSIK